MIAEDGAAVLLLCWQLTKFGNDNTSTQHLHAQQARLVPESDTSVGSVHTPWARFLWHFTNRIFPERKGHTVSPWTLFTLFARSVWFLQTSPRFYKQKFNYKAGQILYVRWPSWSEKAYNYKTLPQNTLRSCELVQQGFWREISLHCKMMVFREQGLLIGL